MEIVEGIVTIEDVDAFVDDLRRIELESGAAIQAFDARYVVGHRHIERAVELAERAADRGEAIARDQSVEILLYAAGRRQINRAFEMGVSEGACPVVAVAVGGDEAGAADALTALLEPAETLGAFDETRVREFFEISDRELAAADATLEDLVCERVALLVVER